MTDLYTYLLSVFAVIAFASFSSYGGEDRGASRMALGIILISALSTPFVSFIKNISFDDLNFEYGEYIENESLAQDTARDAYLRALRLAVAEEFSISEEKLCVSCEGFELESMTAEHIDVILLADAVFADRIGIKNYVEGICKCDVEVEFEKER